MFLKGYICPLLFHILQLNLKIYMDLLLIWGAHLPQKDNSPLILIFFQFLTSPYLLILIIFGHIKLKINS